MFACPLIGTLSGVKFRFENTIDDGECVEHLSREIEGMSTAAVYAAARQAGIPRSLDEVAAVSRIEQLPITRAYRHLTRELELEIEPTDPLDYIPRFASELNLSEEATQRSRTLLTTVIETEESYLSGKNPVGLAVAAVYAGTLLTNEKVTQPAIGEVADISTVTIRKRYQDLLEIREDLQCPMMHDPPPERC